MHDDCLGHAPSTGAEDMIWMVEPLLNESTEIGQARRDSLGCGITGSIRDHSFECTAHTGRKHW
jgi:hypothetical protein